MVLHREKKCPTSPPELGCVDGRAKGNCVKIAKIRKIAKLRKIAKNCGRQSPPLGPRGSRAPKGLRRLLTIAQQFLDGLPTKSRSWRGNGAFGRRTRRNGPATPSGRCPSLRHATTAAIGRPPVDPMSTGVGLHRTTSPRPRPPPPPRHTLENHPNGLGADPQFPRDRSIRLGRLVKPVPKDTQEQLVAGPPRPQRRPRASPSRSDLPCAQEEAWRAQAGHTIAAPGTGAPARSLRRARQATATTSTHPATTTRATPPHPLPLLLCSAPLVMLCPSCYRTPTQNLLPPICEPEPTRGLSARGRITNPAGPTHIGSLQAQTLFSWALSVSLFRL